MAGTYGWSVYAHDERCCDGISDVLWAIFEQARALGRKYVLFDADAPVPEDLYPEPENDDFFLHSAAGNIFRLVIGSDKSTS